MSESKLKLWNPNLAGIWSFIFSMLFGSYIVSLNWKTLGDEKKAKKAKIWFWAGLILFIIAPLLVPNPPALGFIMLIIWYFASQKPQTKYIKETLNNDYEKKSWFKPVIIAILAIIAYVILMFILISISAGVSSRANNGPKASAKTSTSRSENTIKIKGLYLDMDMQQAIKQARTIIPENIKTATKWDEKKTKFTIYQPSGSFMLPLVELDNRGTGQLKKFRITTYAIGILFERKDFSQKPFVQDFVDNYFPGCSFSFSTQYKPAIQNKMIYIWTHKDRKNKIKATLSSNIVEGGVTVEYIDRSKFD